MTTQATFRKAMKRIRKIRAATVETCEGVFNDSKDGCKHRRAVATDINTGIMCDHPGRLNYTNKDNCSYVKCLLVVPIMGS